MMTLHSRDFVALSEAALLKALDAENRRPNLMVLCKEVEISAVVKQVLRYCAPPYHFTVMPGRLDLPRQKRGTLLVTDIAAMTLGQQIALYDFLSDGCRNIQVVSLTSTPLAPLVQAGQFLEGLFYRLNVINLDARPEAETARAH
ncbi:MAG TPA: sigma 54-interacting transcriptional regulator [Vicinamibacterales bacterium]|nr:sigma 54-interacting transcriptional regulator [Vicinamibacterales bacterium]